MTEISDVRFARSGDVSIADQVVGDGPIDLVFVRGSTGDLLSTWEQPLFASHVPGLAENGRLLMLDTPEAPVPRGCLTRPERVRSIQAGRRARGRGSGQWGLEELSRSG